MPNIPIYPGERVTYDADGLPVIVHDNSLVQPVMTPFDAAPELPAVTSSTP